MPPADPAPHRRGALGLVTAFVLLLAVTGLALLFGADDPAGRVFGGVQLLLALLLLALLRPSWRGPSPPGSGPDAGPGSGTGSGPDG
ncbi:MAG TPA: hypothetical protein VFD04_22260 [Actinomycetes bacterium]|nr:hypothetical protein [Actinomycetes bacterium]